MMMEQRAGMLGGVALVGLLAAMGCGPGHGRGPMDANAEVDRNLDMGPTEVEEDWGRPMGTEEPEVVDQKFISDRLERIHFDFDRAEIRTDMIPILEADAAVLRQYRDVRILVEGHCDERGSVEYNLALGERRAKATADYLATLGVSRDRLSTISYGKELPLAPGHDEQAWAANRRAEFVAVDR